MIPYPYNMVDMGGIDLAEANGTVVEGLYAKIVEAVNACGDVVLYNWKFAGIEISPQHTSILLGDPIIISGAVQVTEQDLVTVPGINPDPLVLTPLTVTENGQYTPQDYEADGFSGVNVNVESTMVPLIITENGQYSPQDYDADGFSEVTANVPTAEVPLSYTIPDMQFFNSAGEHQLNLDSSYQHALVGIIARGDYSAAYTPIYEEALDAASLSVGHKAYVYLIDPADGFSFTSVAQRVTAWVIYINRDSIFQVNSIRATAVSGQNAKYTMPNLEGNYFCLIYNSFTNETASAVFQPSPLSVGSNKALRYTYAIISSPKSTTYEYTLSLTLNPEDNSNYVILIKEE